MSVIRTEGRDDGEQKCGGEYVLEVGKTLPPEEWARRGKPESGAHVSVELSVQRALELAQLILSQALGCTERGDTVYLSLFGELRKESK